MPVSRSLDPEPTPEFDVRCTDLHQSWAEGYKPLDEAIDEMTALRTEAAVEGIVANQARAETFLGIMYGYQGNLANSIQYFERARALFTQVGNLKRIATCDLNLGETYRYKGDFNRARQYFERAYETHKELKDLIGETTALCNRGQMFLSLGDLDSAAKDLILAADMVKQLPEENANRNTLSCEISRSLALLYIEQGRLDEALFEAQAAFAIASRTQSPFDVGYANRAMGQVLTAVHESSGESDDSDSPDSYFQRANEAFRDINAEGEVARTMFEHATSLALRGRRIMAAKKLHLAIVIFTRLGMTDDAAKAAEAQREML
ncbi:MAG: tetratricopeptide repeat protein [Anaerolineaceae bacterium]|nr:tetratricopeptide repeat protein [Anaerolineaceae bacterium]